MRDKLAALVEPELAKQIPLHPSGKVDTRVEEKVFLTLDQSSQKSLSGAPAQLQNSVVRPIDVGGSGLPLATILKALLLIGIGVLIGPMLARFG